MRGYFVRATVIVALLASVAAPPANARGIAVKLDGQPISRGQVGALSCHDLDYPEIRSFRSVTALEADASAMLASRSSGMSLAPLTAGYVEVFQDITYAGSAAILSVNQPWLSSIGWNDKISSFKSIGATGRFDENSPSGGFGYYYGSTARIPDVGSFYNDKFSAFFIN